MIQIPVEPFLKYSKKYQNLIKSTLQAGLDSVDPYVAVKREMGNSEIIQRWKYKNDNNIILISIGKASMPMASAAIDQLGNLVQAGVIVTKSINNQYIFDERFVVIEGGHPEPDEMSVEAGEQIRNLITGSDHKAKVLCLISGGGSALVVKPNPEIPLSAYAELNKVLLSHNLPIEEINTIRRSIDEFKGGGLAKWINGRETEVYILSDIVSGELDHVASGPTFPVKGKFSKALQVVADHGLNNQISQIILDYLIRSTKPEMESDADKYRGQTTNISHHVIGDLSTASLAMAGKGQELGYSVSIYRPWLECDLESGVEQIGDSIIGKVKIGTREVLIWGGELTVERSGSGIGGRNCHLGLLLVKKLANIPGFIFIAFATDGDDGNSNAAGVVVDGKTYTKIMQRHINLEYHLNNFDSGSLFKLTGDLIYTGPTGTNVNDLYIAILDPEIGHTGV